jgi:hypothetical protein
MVRIQIGRPPSDPRNNIPPYMAPPLSCAIVRVWAIRKMRAPRSARVARAGRAFLRTLERLMFEGNDCVPRAPALFPTVSREMANRVLEQSKDALLQPA